MNKSEAASIAGSTPRSRHRIVSNFVPHLGEGSHAVTAISLTRLIAMLDCAHHADSRYAVVCKRTNPGGQPGEYASTVLDVPLNRLYRAEHAGSLTAFWEALAVKHPKHVQFLRQREVYVPTPEAPRPPREFWYVRHQGADA